MAIDISREKTICHTCYLMNYILTIPDLIIRIDFWTRLWTACKGVVGKGCNNSIAWQAINNSIGISKKTTSYFIINIKER